jgi:NAD(P)-dependent dehydrogenase (short-subunit alcohol dehydrogenase family)
MGQPPIPPTPKGTSLAGKTIIVTGGNTGLGFEAARQFLVLGCSRMILASRSLSKGEAAAALLRSDPAVQAANPHNNIEVLELDLDSYDSGLRFARQVLASVSELDILLNNGGMATTRYETSPSTGHERTMQVNCYTHVLVSLLLLPLLQQTAAARGSPTRITFVGSATHKSQTTLTRPVPDDVPMLKYFDDPAIFSRFRRYADSKLLVHAYARRMARLAPGEVIVNNLCPGLVQTVGLDQNLPAPLRVVMGWVRKAAARTVEEGARTIVYAAAVAGEETNGRFLSSNRVDQ